MSVVSFALGRAVLAITKRSENAEVHSWVAGSQGHWSASVPH